MTLPYYLKDIADYLQSNGIATFGTDMFFYDYCPGIPNCIVLISAPGLPDLETVDGKTAIFQPELDIRVRNVSGKLAEQKANAIFDLLDGLADMTLGNTEIILMNSISDPYELSHDVNYTIYAVNFQLMIS
jgi:hypothetical protein